MKTSALLTDMDQPLGRAAGNALEVTESIEVLKGEGPRDLVEITLAIAEEMLVLAGVDAEPKKTLADGSALAKWREMIGAQGGDPDTPLPESSEKHLLVAERSGYISRIDARAVGIAAWNLGAGRSQKGEPVSAVAGVVCLKKAGERIAEGEPVLELHLDDPDRLPDAIEALDGAIEIGPDEPEKRPLVIDRIGP